jgi:hypothetical protein
MKRTTSRHIAAPKGLCEPEFSWPDSAGARLGAAATLTGIPGTRHFSNFPAIPIFWLHLNCSLRATAVVRTYRCMSKGVEQSGASLAKAWLKNPR